MDVRSFTVGPFAENTYFVRRDGSEQALVIDPGDEAPRLLGAVAADEVGVLGERSDGEAADVHRRQPAFSACLDSRSFSWRAIRRV